MIGVMLSCTNSGVIKFNLQVYKKINERAYSEEKNHKNDILFCYVIVDKINK